MSIRTRAPLFIATDAPAATEELAEVRVVTDEHGPLGIAGVAQERLDGRRRPGRPPSRSSIAIATPRRSATISAVWRARSLGRRDDRVGL